VLHSEDQACRKAAAAQCAVAATALARHFLELCIHASYVMYPVYGSPFGVPCIKYCCSVGGRCGFPRLHRQCCRAATEEQTTTTTSSSSSAAAAAPAELVPDTEFSITKISYGSILTPVGLGLMVYGFGSYFTLLPGTDLSSLLLIYGFPISILGFALSYAQVCC